jgi:hypothetical protein
MAHSELLRPDVIHWSASRLGRFTITHGIVLQKIYLNSSLYLCNILPLFFFITKVDCAVSVARDEANETVDERKNLLKVSEYLISRLLRIIVYYQF